MVQQASVIKANIRNILGSAESRRLRKSGFLPATVRASDNISYISVDQKEFDKKYFEGSLFSTPMIVDVEGKKIHIITNDVDIHPVSDRPVHADFLQIEDGQEVIAKVKINFTNQDKSVALKRGSFLHTNIRMIELICKNSDFIPKSIDLDVSKVPVGGKIRSDSLFLPENVKLKVKTQFLIASILGRGGAKSSDENAAEADVAQGENKTNSD